MGSNQWPKRTKFIAALMLVVMLIVPAAIRSSPVSAATNPIVIENQQPGTADWLAIQNEPSDATGQIKGYASATSVNKGDSIAFHVSVNPAQNYSIDVYR